MTDNALDRMRRLNAVRAAIRYRNHETGRRHHLHFDLFKAEAIRYVRRLRDLYRAASPSPTEPADQPKEMK